MHGVQDAKQTNTDFGCWTIDALSTVILKLSSEQLKVSTCTDAAQVIRSRTSPNNCHYFFLATVQATISLARSLIKC